MKHQINFRASDLTSSQIGELLNETGMTQTELISNAIDRMYREEIKMIALTDKTIINLKNPWSDSWKEMTWKEIKEWCNHNIHPTDRTSWIKSARIAAQTGDDVSLGKMIIGA